MAKPNLFNFATSELSQDAFLAWLFSWADEKYSSEESLNKCAKAVIKLFTDNDIEVKSVNIYKQYEHIDLWVEINNSISLIIEDKTGTEEHSDQLNRYKEIASKWCNENKQELYCAFFKTQTFSKTKEKRIKEKGYKVISGDELLSVMKQYEADISNDIFTDYYQILQEKYDSQRLYLKTKLEDWDDNSYCFSGFFKELEKYIDITDWEYVPNPRGGFMGCWFCWNVWKYNIEMYLQFENNQLCIRIGELTDTIPEIRTEAYNAILSATTGTPYYNKITKPAKFGSGTYITIAIISEELWFEKGNNGYIDMPGTVKKINKMMDFVTSVCDSN